MSEEVWKDIEEYEGLYQVSNFGRVKSLKRYSINNANTKNRLLKLSLNRKGYLNVTLCKNGKYKSHRIHRLVAQAFIPNPENKPQVNHIDEIKTNNMVSNLNWMTNKENRNHGTAIKRMCVTNSKPIIATNLKTDESTKFNSGKECARQLGLNQAHITDVLKGRRKQTGGYIFEYAI